MTAPGGGRTAEGVRVHGSPGAVPSRRIPVASPSSRRAPIGRLDSLAALGGNLLPAGRPLLGVGVDVLQGLLPWISWLRAGAALVSTVVEALRRTRVAER